MTTQDCVPSFLNDLLAARNLRQQADVAGARRQEVYALTTDFLRAWAASRDFVASRIDRLSRGGLELSLFRSATCVAHWPTSS